MYVLHKMQVKYSNAESSKYTPN